MSAAFIWENVHKSESNQYMNQKVFVTAGGGIVQ